MPSGPRVRTDNVFGTTTDNPLLVGATSLNSAGLANLAAVSSAHAILVLDPLRAAGAPEVVVVTAHTGAATVATVTRGAYGTVARQHAAGTLWVHAPTVDDLIRICTSATRPSDPYRGQLLFETDTDSFVARSVADAWQTVVDLGAWDAWVPTWTNLTVGNGTVTAQWTRLGRSVHVDVRLVWGSTTSASGNIQCDLPVNATTNPRHIGAAHFFDNGTRHFIGAALIGRQGADNAEFIHTESGNSGTVNATNPFTWTTSDELSFSAVYEAAA